MLLFKYLNSHPLFSPPSFRSLIYIYIIFFQSRAAILDLFQKHKKIRKSQVVEFLENESQPVHTKEVVNALKVGLLGVELTCAIVFFILFYYFIFYFFICVHMCVIVGTLLWEKWILVPSGHLA